MLKKEIKVTGDGSKTLYIPEWNESYHSRHGAVQEATHVFIKNGIQQLPATELHVLEYGFGTGLNVLLTALFALKKKQKIFYTTLEKFPLTVDETNFLEFESSIYVLDKEFSINEIKDYFNKIHQADWNVFSAIHPFFELRKIETDFKDFQGEKAQFDIVYFDAFGIRVQPELWDHSILKNTYDCLKPGGLFTTYASNGATQKALKACGFNVEKKPGPPGKREMINAWK